MPGEGDYMYGCSLCGNAHTFTFLCRCMWNKSVNYKSLQDYGATKNIDIPSTKTLIF